MELTTEALLWCSVSKAGPRTESDCANVVPSEVHGDDVDVSFVVLCLLFFFFF